MSELKVYGDTTTGVVFIHATPVALCQHVEWSLRTILERSGELTWTEQPAVDGARKAIIDWIGPVGTAARLAQALEKWDLISFEVTEDPSEMVDGERYSYTPKLGMWRGQTGASGDVVIGEDRIRHLMAQGAAAFHAAMDEELGTAWDAELEPLRGYTDTPEVTWLSRVG